VTCYADYLRPFIYLLIASASNACVVGAGHSLSTGTAGKDPRDRVANPFSDPPFAAEGASVSRSSTDAYLGAVIPVSDSLELSTSYGVGVHKTRARLSPMLSKQINIDFADRATVGVAYQFLALQSGLYAELGHSLVTAAASLGGPNWTLEAGLKTTQRTFYAKVGLLGETGLLSEFQPYTAYGLAFSVGTVLDLFSKKSSSVEAGK
jgi:hypothetical protein